MQLARPAPWITAAEAGRRTWGKCSPVPAVCGRTQAGIICEFGAWQPAAIRNRGPPESETMGSFDPWRKGSDREGPSYYCQPARVPYIGGTTRQKAPLRKRWRVMVYSPRGGVCAWQSA